VFFFIGCGRNFHKRCVSDLPDNCSPMARKISDVALPHDDVNKKAFTFVNDKNKEIRSTLVNFRYA
jgi:hypothetical protein